MGATAKVSRPDPVALLPELIVIQLLELATSQGHVGVFVSTSTFALPPLVPKF